MGGKRQGISKSGKGKEWAEGEFDQNTLCTCMELSKTIHKRGKSNSYYYFLCATTFLYFSI